MISFTQNLISIDEANAKICWIVENHSSNVIRDVNAYSDIYSYSFGDIGIDSIKSITFTIPLSKAGLIGKAIMNYIQDDDTCIVKSNILTSMN